MTGVEAIEKYQPLINSTVNRYSGGSISKDLLKLHAEILVDEAIKTYDPSKGHLSSHVQNYLKSMSRFVNDASIVYIPESRAYKYNKFKETVNKLTKDKGRSPTYDEIADRMKIGIADVRKLSQETSKELISNEVVKDMYEMPFDPSFNQHKYLEFVNKKISDPLDKKVFSYTFGVNGYPSITTNTTIAKRLDTSESSIRRSKDRLAEVMKEYK